MIFVGMGSRYMRMRFVLSLVFLLCVGTGCQNVAFSEGEKDVVSKTTPTVERKKEPKQVGMALEGYVVSKYPGVILVMRGITPDDIKKYTINDLLHLSGVEKVVWFAVSNSTRMSKEDREGLEIGQKVTVWSDKISESYPAQADALKVTVIK